MKKTNRMISAGSLVSICLLICTAGCTKNFLDAKPDQTLVVPQTLTDLQALLDNTSVNNVNMPSLQEASSDDFYLTGAGYAAITAPEYRNAYVWAADIYAGDNDIFDWNYRYQQIFYANVVLEGLAELVSADQASVQGRSEKGTALFYRAFALYQVERLFCKPYDAASAATDIGVPVRTASDINKVSTRASVAASYQQVLGDLQQSLILLPDSVTVKTRPNVAAAYGLLARVCLSMRDYSGALANAQAALKRYPALMDYNTLNATAADAFSRYNAETIFYSTLGNTSLFSASRLLVDTALYASYDSNDLRRALFFKGAAGGDTYKGSYSGSTTFFNGIATDELYLISAECEARLGATVAAMSDLNRLLSFRWRTGTFSPLSAASAGAATQLVLAERRKELIYRGLRWTDLRRLNLDGAGIVLRRDVAGLQYTLQPNDERYELPIPALVIQLSGIAQNPR